MFHPSNPDFITTKLHELYWQKHSHSRLRYLCTLGFPLIAAILTGLQPGLMRILVEVVEVSRPLIRLLVRLPLSNENETSDSVPVFDKNKKNDGANSKIISV